MQLSRPANVFGPMLVMPVIAAALAVIVYALVAQSQRTSQAIEAARLPWNVLPRPPAGMLEPPVTVLVTSRGTVIVGGVEVPAGDAKSLLQREHDALAAQGRSPARTTVIVRADPAVSTGQVQKVLESGEQSGFERFVLRQSEQGAARP